MTKSASRLPTVRRSTSRLRPLRACACLTLLAAVAPVPGLAAQQQETGTFTMAQNGMEIATETFTRTPTSLETQLVLVNQGTFQAKGTLRPDATFRRLEIRVYGPGGATGEPIQTSAVTFENGMATVEQPIGTVYGEPSRAGAGAVVYLNPSPSFMEQVLRRARAMGGDTVGVPIWTPAPGGSQVLEASVVFDDERATLTLAAVAVEFVTDGHGRILSGRVPSQGLVIQRK